MSAADGSRFDGYESALSGRYASEGMQEIFSARRRFETWRRIWLAVAEAQCGLGLPVSPEQVEELRANLEVTDGDIERASELEAELRHDVMSHVHAWGERCPGARGIIHLGMTSQDVNDNCESLLLGEACGRIIEGCERLTLALGEQAAKWAEVPCLALTHYQPAQPTTVGRRFAQWAHDLDLVSFESPDLRGLRGATGTQASFLALCEGDADLVERLELTVLLSLVVEFDRDEEFEEEDVERLEELLADTETALDEIDDEEDEELLERLRMERYDLTAQTYPRVVEAQMLAGLAGVCAVLHKMATDIRLLSNRGELDEPTGAKQVGSSAMPHKRNPMRCERVCGLARFVMNLVGNAYETAAVQWLERTLDDSSNRRLVLPEAFLATDACLNIMRGVVRGLEVHEGRVAANLAEELPFLAGERLMMEAAKLGRDRQDVHEAIRRHARAASERMRAEGAPNDLMERLADEPLLKDVDLEDALDPAAHVGLAVEQTERFLADVVDPLREQHEDDDEEDGDDSGPRV